MWLKSMKDNSALLGRDKIRLVSLLVICVVGVLFYVQDQYALSYIDDDLYQFVVPEDRRYFTESLVDPKVERVPIETWGQVIESNVNAYQNSNGRFLVHCVVQACCSFMSMDVFVVINTLFFCLFVWFVLRLNQLRSPAAVVLVATLFWLLMYKGAAFLGNRAFSVNYLWCAVANLFFFWLHDKVRGEWRNAGKWQQVLLFVAGTVIGSLSESFSFGIAAAFFVYYLFRRKQLSWPVAAMLLGYFVGTAFAVFAPGNFLRAEGRVTGFHINIGPIYQCLTMPINFVYLMSVFGLTMFNRNKLVQHIKNHAIMLLAIGFNVLFWACVAYNGKHQQTAVNVFCLVLLVNLLSSLQLTRRQKIVSLAALTLISLVTYFPIHQLRKDLYRSYYACIDQDMQACKGVIVDEEYQKYVGKVRTNPLIKDYFISVMNIQPKPVSMRKTQGKNIFLIKKVIPFAPSKMESFCTEANKLFERVYRCDYNYVACKLDKKCSLSDIQLQYRESYFFSTFLREEKSTAQPYLLIENQGSYYYLFPPNMKVGEVVALNVKE